jgi:hypothetical protein
MMACLLVPLSRARSSWLLVFSKTTSELLTFYFSPFSFAHSKGSKRWIYTQGIRSYTFTLRSLLLTLYFPLTGGF